MKTYLLEHAATSAVTRHALSLKRASSFLAAFAVSVSLLANNNTQSFTHSSIAVDSNGTSSSTDGLSGGPSSTQIAGTNGAPASNQFSLPLVMTAFKAVVTDRKVVLNWTTGIEKGLSYFVVERSMNGKDYYEAAIVFAAGAMAVKQNYSFTDLVNISTNGLLYYRIRIVDMNGRFQNSAVKLIRVGDQTSLVNVQAYPNPVLDEIRITIPAGWQNQHVRYEVYNTNGRLVKRMNTNNANQTEVVDMHDCGTGLYVVKTSTATESCTQTIFKK